MNVEIGTDAEQSLFWEYMFKILGIVICSAWSANKSYRFHKRITTYYANGNREITKTVGPFQLSIREIWFEDKHFFHFPLGCGVAH